MNDIDTSNVIPAKAYNLVLDATSDEYILTAVNLNSELYQGVIDCSGNPSYPAGEKDWYWRVSVAGLIGGGSGLAVDIGDEIICIADNGGGTQALVGTSYMIINVNISPCTVAEARTGTSNSVYATPALLTALGITTAAATPLGISSGTTQQLSLAASAAQLGLYISQTAATTGYAISISSAIADTTTRLVTASSSMSTAYTTAKTLYGYYHTHTSNGTDVDGAEVSGHVSYLSSTGLSKISYNGFNALFAGTYTAAAGTQYIAGFNMVSTITLNSATTTLYGVNVSLAGVTRTSATAVYAGRFVTASTATSAILVSNSANTIDICNGTTALTITGTVSKGIDFSTTTLTQGQENAFVHIGAWTTPKTITGQTEHYAPIQVNLASNSTIAKNITAARFRVDTVVANTLTAVYGIQIRNAIAHDVASFYGCHASANLGTFAVITGAIAVGSFYLEGTGTITPAGSNPIDVCNVTNVHSGTGVTNCLNVCNNTASAVGTVATFSNLAGVVTDMIYIHNDNTTTNGLHVDNDGTMATGILLEGAITTGISVSGACTTGINISGANSASLSIRGTLALTTGRAITSAVTIQNANLGDGYGVNEFQLDLTGTVTGASAASSSWVNITSGTTGVNMICAQTNGIYAEAGGLLAGSTLIFGMRADCLVSAAGSAPAESYPFSIVNQVTLTTALIQCNDASSDLGKVTNIGVDNGTLVPLYKDNTGVKYVKIYTLFAT